MTHHFLALWKEARTRFTNQLEDITESDLKKKLGDGPNSAGFLIRHMAEVELLFAKNVFGLDDVKITAKTIIDGKDTGKWTNLAELKTIAEKAEQQLKKAIEQQEDKNWESEVETKEFGKKTLAEAFGRVTSHTAYHAGQLAIVVKYGTSKQ